MNVADDHFKDLPPAPQAYIREVEDETGARARRQSFFLSDRSNDIDSDLRGATMNPQEFVEVKMQVPKHLVGAFNQAVREFFVQARGGKTTGQLAEEVRASDRDAGLDSLVHLLQIAEHDSGQSRTVACFLAGLYNGTDFPFDLTELRGLDADLYEHCLAVLRLDSSPSVEIHQYLPDGTERFRSMIRAWNLDNRPDAEPVPVEGERYNVRYITYSNAPGYRAITLSVGFEDDLSRERPVKLNFTAEDSARISRDILDIHRSCWRDSEPIDKKPGENRPTWL